MEALQGRSRIPEVLFWLLAATGFAGTQVQFPHYLSVGLVEGTIAFFRDSVANPAATFLLVDILVLMSAVYVWAFGEARRIGMRGIWVYFLGSLLIGVSTFAPLFFAMRERRLRQIMATGEWELCGTDWLAVGLMVVLSLAAAAYSLGHIPA